MTDSRTNEPKQSKTKSSQDFVFSEAQVEAAAKAMWERIQRKDDPAWGDLDYGVKEEYRKDARAALVAAQGAAPAPSGGVDEDKLAEVIAKSRGFGNGWEQIPPLTREAYREVARAVAEWLKGQGGESR